MKIELSTPSPTLSITNNNNFTFISLVLVPFLGFLQRRGRLWGGMNRIQIRRLIVNFVGDGEDELNKLHDEGV